MSCIVYNVRNLDRFGLTGADAIIFERRYASTVFAAKGEPVIYYAARTSHNGGEYVAAGRVGDVFPHPVSSGHVLASVFEYSRFSVKVRAFGPGRNYEHSLFGYNWRSMAVRTVRPLPDDQALAILDDASSNSSSPQGFRELEQSAYLPSARGIESFSRLRRWLGLRHRCRSAYDYRCSFTGIGLRDGKGNFEADCCHILPVADLGPDEISNSLLLCKTMHWALDHFLISLEDDFRIIVSDAFDPRYKSLLNENGHARIPADPALQPSVRYLRQHRARFFSVHR